MCRPSFTRSPSQVEVSSGYDASPVGSVPPGRSLVPSVPPGAPTHPSACSPRTPLRPEPAVAVFVDLVDPGLLEPPADVLRLALHPRGLARYVDGLDEYPAHLVSRLRRQVDRSADPALGALFDELVGHCRTLGLDPDARPRNGVVLPLRLRHPDGLRTFLSTVSVLGAPLDITLEEVAVESFFPAAAPTADHLHRRFGGADHRR
ncbi:hypothetical protein ACL02T_21110 [Pseudonocardia sp. RS010]|uniref:MmyB family transcriptional regulator n=1 Tax=Pseudonocardia sp. RS010 TaxID=3385979 RepID=UPI0039A2BFF6